MRSQDFERREWLGVFGAGLIAAAITALAMPGPANSPSSTVIQSSHEAVDPVDDGLFAGKRLEGR